MLILASGSPRRAKILRQLGVTFAVRKSDAPEVSYPGDPERTVRENALAKGAALLAEARQSGDGVLSADTIVWLDGKIYGKPRDLEEAKAFLRAWIPLPQGDSSMYAARRCRRRWSVKRRRASVDCPRLCRPCGGSARMRR